MSAASHSSAYGPYVRTGRGGAGNFTWQSATELKPKSSQTFHDVEAQPQPPTHSSLAERRKVAAKLEAIDTQEAVRMRQSSAQYLGSGRGGAGNFVVGGDRAPPQRSPSLPIHLIPSRHSPTRTEAVYRGRGGAGNYAVASATNGQNETEKAAKERIEAEKRRELIVEEVEGMLQPPPVVWLGGRRKSEAVDEEEAV